jgi:lysophospholipase L1-like esterase
LRTLALGVVAAPLLLAQGLWVRRVTPVLPEAQGPRAGVLAPRAPGPPLRLLIVGDSSAAGVGARRQDEALSGRLAAALAARGGCAVHWRLVARTGATARELPAMLQEHRSGAFDVALVVVGVNDVTGLRPLRAWLADLDALAARLREVAPRGRLVASGLPPMHRFPALPQPLRAFLGARAIEFDRALARWAQGQPDAIHVPLPEMDDPALAASDGFHPGPGAYALWADALAGAVAALAGVPARPDAAPGRRARPLR